MKRPHLWHHGIIIVLICGVGVLGRTGSAGAPGSVTSDHQNLDCSLCHSLVASLDEDVAVASPTERCHSCHGAPDRNAGGLAVVFHASGDRSCGDCHRFHEPGMIEAGDNVFAPARSGGPASCAACHDGSGMMTQLSEGHRLAADMYHSNDPALTGLNASDGCLLCHADEGGQQVAGLESAGVPRFSGHRMHPVGPVQRRGEYRGGVRVRAELDPRLRLYDGRIECHTCHQLTAGTRYRLVDLGSPRELCLACHEFE